jgi:hypothetical protein
MTSVPEVLKFIASGALGAGVTYGLTWFRERRRTLDAYRAPQRQAIGDIIAATHELVLSEYDLREAVTELLDEAAGRPHRELSDDHLAAVQGAMSRAVLGADRAFNVGRLTIVDATCFESMGVAYNEFVQLKGAFGDMTASADNMARITAEIQRYTGQLNRHVADLVLASHRRVSPVQSLWNRGRRRAVRRRLEARYFEQRDPEGQVSAHY